MSANYKATVVEGTAYAGPACCLDVYSANAQVLCKTVR